MQHLRNMQERDTMGSGDVDYRLIAVAMNETFHIVDPVRYQSPVSDQTWHQIKAKDNNMRANS